MPGLNRLWQALRLLNAAQELASESRQLEWSVTPPNTFFLQAEHCHITLSWHEQRRILARLDLQAGFGWQWTSDQDEAGVYLIARRKHLIGGLGTGKIAISLPHGIHISLKLQGCQLCCHGLNGSLELPPFQPDAPSHIIAT